MSFYSSNLAPINKSFMPLLYDQTLKEMDMYNYGSINQNDNVLNFIAENILKLNFNVQYRIRGDMRRVLNHLAHSLVDKINRRSKQTRAEVHAEILSVANSKFQVSSPTIYLKIYETGGTHKQYQVGVTSTNMVLLGTN